MVFYLYTIKPFEEQRTNVVAIVDEFSIVVSVGILTPMTIWEIELETRKIMGWVMIVVILAVISKSFYIVIKEGIQNGLDNNTW